MGLLSASPLQGDGDKKPRCAQGVCQQPEPWLSFASTEHAFKLVLRVLNRPQMSYCAEEIQHEFPLRIENSRFLGADQRAEC